MTSQSRQDAARSLFLPDVTMPAADRRSGGGAAVGLASTREFASTAGVFARLFRHLLDDRRAYLCGFVRGVVYETLCG